MFTILHSYWFCIRNFKKMNKKAFYFWTGQTQNRRWIHSFFCYVGSRKNTYLDLHYILNVWNLEPKPKFRARSYLLINRYLKQSVPQYDIVLQTKKYHNTIYISWPFAKRPQQNWIFSHIPISLWFIFFVYQFYNML